MSVELKVFWRTMRRRWYLTLAVLALTVAGTAYVVAAVGPSYKAEGAALVFPPSGSARSEETGKADGNPYLELAGVSQARDVVIRTLSSRTIQKDWEESFPGMTYEATPDYTNSAPMILFTVVGDTPTGAAAALDDLMSRVPSILLDLQDGLSLPPDGLVTARTLTQDTQPAMERKGQIRAGLLTMAVTGGLGLLLLAICDSLLGLRARLRAEQAAPREATPSQEHAPADHPGESRVSDVASASARPVRPSSPPVESETAESPARSKWVRSARIMRTGSGPRVGDDAAPVDLLSRRDPRARDRGPAASVAGGKPRNIGRNR